MNFDKHVKPLYMNGLQGRMLSLPSKKPNSKLEILLLPGHHNSLERMQTFAEIFAEHGNVTIPDLPGFGGMDSFYKIGLKPTLDNLADYLAAFIKLRYKSKKFVMVGVSFSVPVYVRMLQKYPEIQKKISGLVSLSGFVHKEDFKFNNYEIFIIKLSSWLLSRGTISFIASKLFFTKPIIKFFLRMDYLNLKNRQYSDKKALENRINIDAELWAINDLRTAFYTYVEMFDLDLCSGPNKIKLPFYNLSCEGDNYFNKSIVDQHMQVIFDDYHQLNGVEGLHVPGVEASIDVVREYIPIQQLVKQGVL